MQVNDVEVLSPLQIFLLALVEHGLTTPYDLLSKAGLGVGLTSPALKRLEAAGLLTSTPGPRKRQRYAITEKGQIRLRESVTSNAPSYWQAGRVDSFESLPRGITLAWLYVGAAEAHQGIAKTSDDLAFLARARKAQADEIRAAIPRLQAEIVKQDSTAAKGRLVAATYQWLKTEADAALFRLQAQAIAGMHSLIENLPAAPQ